MRHVPVRRARCAAALLAAVTLASGCSMSNLQFKNDHRLTFESPKSREKVEVPVTIRWRMEDFEVAGLDGSRDKNKGTFAVFVDRAPMPAGKDLKWLVRNDTSCKRDPRCPDLKYLADANVYVTNETSVTLEILPRAPQGVGDEQHYVNVVLLDGSGHRIGESAWYRPFTSKRRTV